MITVKDRESLENIGGLASARKLKWMYFVPVMLSMASAFNLWMASLWGQRAGYSLPALIKLFMRGTDPSQSYPGSLIHAEDQLEMALFSFGMAIITLVIATQHRKLFQFHLRIRATLKQSGRL